MRSVPDGYKELASTLLLGLPGHRLRIIRVETPKEGAPGPMQVPLKLKLVSRAASIDGRLLKDAATSTLAQAPERRNCEFVPVGNAPRGQSNAEAAWLNLLVRWPESGENPAGTKAREPFAASLALSRGTVRQPAVGCGGEPLCAAAASESCVAHCALKESAVHRVQVRQQDGDLGQEWVGKDGGDFLVAHTPGIPNQLADVNIQSRSQSLQRAECRNCLAVLDLRDIGAGHLHPSGELALAQVPGLADIAHLPGDLQPGFLRGCKGGVGDQLQGRMGRLLDVESLVALPAKGVGGSVLD
jgi:hypothetical protein